MSYGIVTGIKRNPIPDHDRHPSFSENFIVAYTGTVT
ncbi:hypothetical protein QO009_002111 [Brevibacillus aydinogluensis]|jgi:hypothetical protein|nr:hypothetical protein [Brevibacillus aydinogluensis]